jgi:hypothetical protein
LFIAWDSLIKLLFSSEKNIGNDVSEVNSSTIISLDALFSSLSVFKIAFGAGIAL